MRKRSPGLKFILYVLIASCLCILVLFLYYKLFGANGELVEFSAYSDAAAFGNSFGPVSAFFSALAFLGVLATVWLQRSQIDEEKYKLELQRFEGIFFNLLSIYQKHRENMQMSSLRFDLGNMHTNTVGGGRLIDSFWQQYDIWHRDRLMPSGVDFESHQKLVLELNNDFLKKYYEVLDPYYRILFHLLDLVKSSGLRQIDKRRYAMSVRVLMSNSEMLLLFYIAIGGYRDDSVEIVTELAFFEELSKFDILDGSNFYLYPAAAFG